MGNLYNKEALLESLINKNLNTAFGHIRGLKDVVTLKFTKNPNYNIAQDADGQLPALFVCPVTGIEFNGVNPFHMIVTNGFVLSDKAIREVGIDNLQSEYGPFSGDDLVKLLPFEDELPSLRNKLVDRRNKKRSHKEKSKAEKARKHGEVEGIGGEYTKDGSMALVGNEKDSSKHSDVRKRSKTSSSSAIQDNNVPKKLGQNSSVATSVKAAIEEQQQNSKVYKGLFHNDHEQDKKDRDLFMSVAGLRYTLR